MTRIRGLWWLMWGAALVAAPAGRLAAQEEPNANSQVQPAETPGTAPSIPEALDRARVAIEAAEKGGPDAADNLRRAQQLANYVLASDPINMRATFILGRCELLQGRAREALGKIDAYVQSKEGETDWLGYKLLGDIHHDGKYYKLARTKYERAAALNPNESSIFVGLARVELQLDYNEEAVGHARQAVALDRESKPDPYTVLARALLADKQFDDAVEAIQHAIDLTLVQIRNEPSDLRLLADLDRRYQIAQQILTSELSVYRDRADIYLRIAALIQNRADLASLLACHQALDVLKVALENTAPNTPANLLYEMAKLQYRVGRDDDALDSLAAALEKQPDYPEAQQLQEHIQRERGETPPEQGETPP